MAPTDRVSDTERDAVVARLQEHVGTGRLDVAEFDLRTVAAYGAVTRADLDEVTADLPHAPAVAVAAPEPLDDTHRQEWLAWAGVGLLCTVIWIATCLGTASMLYPWPVWVVGPWGAALLVGAVTGHRFGCANAGFPYGPFSNNWDRAWSEYRKASRSKVDVDTITSSAPVRSKI